MLFGAGAAQKVVRQQQTVRMSKPRILRLLALARKIAAENPAFQAVLGPGDGNRSTNSFLLRLRAAAMEEFGKDFSEQKICGNTSQAVDFYFPQEATIVELALGLPNPASEFEKDVLKAIMAQECGHTVEQLHFISRPGATKKCAQPGRASVTDWARKKHNINIEIHELEGEPRRRKRRTI